MKIPKGIDLYSNGSFPRLGFMIHKEAAYLTTVNGWTLPSWVLTLTWPWRSGWRSKTWRWYR